MNSKGSDQPTAVTKISSSQKSDSHPLMSFTAVMTHQAMAEAFINELTRVAQKIIPDRDVTPHDIFNICQLALNDKIENSVTMVGGRHLRARITEQVSRARRYKEPFSLIAMNLDNISTPEDYESIVDTLRERMRHTDLLFLFKVRIVILLPHTEENSCSLLVGRIRTLIEQCLDKIPKIDMHYLTYPHPDMVKTSQILDWAENQLCGR